MVEPYIGSADYFADIRARNITSSVTQAIESQTSSLKALFGNTPSLPSFNEFARRAAESAAFAGIGQGLYENAQYSKQIKDQMIKHNRIMLAIAQMTARNSKVNISDFLPEYFPKPPIKPDPTLVEKIRIANAGIQTAHLSLATLTEEHGQTAMAEHLTLFFSLSVSQFYSFKPTGLLQTMAWEFYKQGREQKHQYDSLVYQYKQEQDAIVANAKDTLEKGRVRQKLEEVRDVAWQGCGAQILPLIVNANYGKVPNFDQQILVGFQLECPPLYQKTEKPLMIAYVSPPVWWMYRPDFGNVTTYSNFALITLLEGNFPKVSLIRPYLYETDWYEKSGPRRSEKYLRVLEPSFIRWLNDTNWQDTFSHSSNPSQFEAVVSQSQIARITRTQSVKKSIEGSKDRVSQDQAKIPEIEDQIKTAKQDQANIDRLEADRRALTRKLVSPKHIPYPVTDGIDRFFNPFVGHIDQRVREVDQKRAVEAKRVEAINSRIRAQIESVDRNIQNLRNQLQAGNQLAKNGQSQIPALAGAVVTLQKQLEAFNLETEGFEQRVKTEMARTIEMSLPVIEALPIGDYSDEKMHQRAQQMVRDAETISLINEYQARVAGLIELEGELKYGGRSASKVKPELDSLKAGVESLKQKLIQRGVSFD